MQFFPPYLKTKNCDTQEVKFGHLDMAVRQVNNKSNLFSYFYTHFSVDCIHPVQTFNSVIQDKMIPQIFFFS